MKLSIRLALTGRGCNIGRYPLGGFGEEDQVFGDPFGEGQLAGVGDRIKAFALAIANWAVVTKGCLSACRWLLGRTGVFEPQHVIWIWAQGIELCLAGFFAAEVGTTWQ